MPELDQARVLIVTPVYNDWASFQKLLDDIDQSLAGHCASLSVITVNDGSAQPPPERLDRAFNTIDRVELLDLAINLGNQRAIAVGLAYASRLDADCIVVMDSDGDDKPSDIARLLGYFAQEPGAIHVVERGKRSDSLLFRIYYRLYKTAFYLSTGAKLAHGNFSLLPMRSAIGILHSANTWNNLAASIVRSKLPYRAHTMDRGRRYEGQSSVNFTFLLLHGLSSISVYLEVVTARLLVASALALAALIAMLFVVIGIRVFSDLAIPGWATVAAGILLIIITQVIMLAFNVLLNLLYNRSQSLTVPAMIDKLYVVAVRVLYASERG